MKTTIKLTTSSSIVVNPLKKGGAMIEVTTSGTASGKKPLTAFSLTPDQIGVLLFALEQTRDAGFMTKVAA